MGIYREERRTPLGDSQIVLELPQFEAHIELWGWAPVQGHGTTFGREVYFRARHDEWSFEVADEAGNLPSDGKAGPTGFMKRSPYPEASYMPLEKAKKIIERELEEFASRA